MVDIGRRLRTAREAQGISLQVAEDDTKIRRKYIEAMENGLEADIPGEAYFKGFLRTYGNYLGLDGVALVDEYKGGKAAPPPDRGVAAAAATAATQQPAPGEARPARVPRTAPVQRATPRQPGERRRVSANTKKGNPLRGLSVSVLGVAVLVAILYLGWLIAGQFLGNAADGKPNPAPSSQTPPPPVTTPEPTPAPKLPDPPKITFTKGSGQEVLFAVPPGPVTVEVEFGTERPWLSAVADGKTLHEGLAQAPTMKFEGKQLRIRMGHMNNVSLVVNGQRLVKPLEGGPFTLVLNGQ